MTPNERLEFLAAMAASGGASAEELAELETLRQEYGDQEILAFDELMSEVALGLTPVTPPPDGLAKLKAELAGQGSAPVASSTEEAAAEEAPIISLAARRKQKTTLAFAGACAAAAAVFAFLWLSERGERAESALQAKNTEQRLKERESAYRALSKEFAEESQRNKGIQRTLDRQNQLIGAPDVQFASMRPAGAKEESINVFILPGRRWVAAGKLPDPGASKDYQLWFVPKDGSAPISAGVFERVEGQFRLEVTLPADLPELKAAAVSLEPAGGSKAPTEVKMAAELI